MTHSHDPQGPAADAHADAALADARELADFMTDQDPLDAEAALWAARRQDGLTPQEEAELQDWLAGEPERARRLAQLQGLWDRLDEVPADEVAKLKTLVMPAATPPRRADWVTGRHARPANWGAWVAGWVRWARPLALAGMVAMTTGGAWMGWQHWRAQPLAVQTHSAARGQQMHLSLPDGSLVHLDADTQITVTLYRQRREVQLWRGQALFTVQANAQRPFHVLAGPMRITVVGTRFAVRHHASATTPDAPRVSVVVEEGHVRVTSANAVGSDARDVPPPLADLYAGDAVVANTLGRIQPMPPTAAASAMAWREGRIVFNNTPLSQAVAEFERYADTGLRIVDPAVAALRVSGSFDVRQARAFKQALPLALPVRLRQHTDGAVEVVGE